MQRQLKKPGKEKAKTSPTEARKEKDKTRHKTRRDSDKKQDERRHKNTQRQGLATKTRTTKTAGI